VNAALTIDENYNEETISELKSLPRYNVLIVDDDPINLHVLRNHLALNNFHVLQAISGPQALEILDGPVKPDIVLLDVMMPRMSGLEVCRKFRESYSLYDLPVIMLTAKNRVEDIIAGFEAGANDYLPKPFDIKELMARVNTYINLKNAVQSHQKLALIQEELKIAQRLQLSIIPTQNPAVNGIEIGSMYLPKAYIGGDFFDYHIIDDKKIGVIIADVSGHGIPSSLISSMLKIAFSIHKNLAERPADMLRAISAALFDMMSGNFVTACYLFIDLSAMKIVSSSAGHDPLIIHTRGTNQIRYIKPKGQLIGLLKQDLFHEGEAGIAPGDRIILYTDGIVECRNDCRELFGEERFHDIILNSSHLPCHGFIKFLMNHIIEWTFTDEGFEDDLTLIAIDIL